MDDALFASVNRKKAELDALRPLSGAALAGLQRHYDVELTYTSNAIEGNTLTLRETAEVIAHGLTIGGKPLRDHLEAQDHYTALQWVREIAASSAPISEAMICELHRRIFARSRHENAGIYRRSPHHFAGSQMAPDPADVPALMDWLGKWLAHPGATPKSAFATHFRLAAIQPFTHGNGQTSRLLMNLVLLRGGYMPVAIRPEDRTAYLEALGETAQDEGLAPFQTFMHARLDSTLADYLLVLSETIPDPPLARG